MLRVRSLMRPRGSRRAILPYSQTTSSHSSTPIAGLAPHLFGRVVASQVRGSAMIKRLHKYRCSVRTIACVAALLLCVGVASASQHFHGRNCADDACAVCCSLMPGAPSAAIRPVPAGISQACRSAPQPDHLFRPRGPLSPAVPEPHPSPDCTLEKRARCRLMLAPNLCIRRLLMNYLRICPAVALMACSPAVSGHEDDHGITVRRSRKS